MAGKKLAVEAWIENPYLETKWIARKREMVVSIHIPVRSHSETVESSSD